MEGHISDYLIPWLLFLFLNLVTLTVLSLCQHPDHYSRTKSIAEQCVLSASGSTLQSELSYINQCTHPVSVIVIK